MSTHSRAGTLSRLFQRHRPVPNPGHLGGGYEGALMENAPAVDLQDDGSRMEPFPRYDADAEWVRARRDRPAEETHEPPLPQDWYGHGPTRFDNFPPPAPRDYAPEAAAWQGPPLFTPLTDRPAPPPLPDGLVARMARLVYPPFGAPPERWAAVMRQVRAYTGTATGYEQPAAWGCLREPPLAAPALDIAIVTGAGFGLHRPALEAPALPDFRVAEKMAAALVPGGPLL